MKSCDASESLTTEANPFANKGSTICVLEPLEDREGTLDQDLESKIIRRSELEVTCCRMMKPTAVTAGVFVFPTEVPSGHFFTPRPTYFPTSLLSITGENTPAARGVSPRCQLIGGNRRELRVTEELWASYRAVAALHISSSSENQAVQNNLNVPQMQIDF